MIPIARSTIRQLAAKGLGAYFTAVVTVASANPHLTLTVPQLQDVAVDAEKFQFWYVQRSNPAAVNINTSSGANPTVVTCTTDHFVAPGDVILIAGHDNSDLNGTRTVLTTPTTTTFTIPVNGALHGPGSGGSFTIVSQFRLITTTGLPAASTITMQRAFQGGAAFAALPAGTQLEFYLVLAVDEWNSAVDDAHKDKFYKDRIVIPIVANTTEYDLSVSNPWFYSKGQFIRGRFRDSTNAVVPIEYELATIYFEETAYGVKVNIPVLPINTTSISAILEVRHYYPAFANDVDTTTCPERLIVTAARHEALKRIYQKLGPTAKKVYGMEMVLTEKDLAEQEARFLDNSAKREMSDDDFPFGGDPERGQSWGW